MIVWRHQSQLHLFTLCKFLCSDFDVSSFGFIAFTKVVMWQLAFLWLWGKQLEQKNSFNEMPHPHYMTLLAGVVQFNVYFWQRQTEYVQGWRSFQLMLYYSGMCTSALWIHDYKLHELLDPFSSEKALKIRIVNVRRWKSILSLQVTVSLLKNLLWWE